MKTIKLSVLEQAMSDFLDHDTVADGEDGWIHPGLSIEMAKAAEQVYDSAMNAQAFAEEQED